MSFEINAEDIQCLELLVNPIVRGKMETFFQHLETLILFVLSKQYEDFAGDIFIAGSAGEGMLGVPFLMQKQTDIDAMVTLKGYLAVERHYMGRNSNYPYYDILKVEHSHLFPGYVFLRILENDLSASYFPAADMKDYFEGSSMRNALANCFGTVINSCNMAHGPAFMMYIDEHDPMLSPCGYLDSVDCVFGIHCNEWPSVADEWFQRNRMYNWPSSGQIADIVEMGCEFVPVGIPGSESENIQWRTSFVRAERYLIRSMNSAQIKTFCLLKIIFKGKVFGEFFHQKISSYVAKTTLLWISEEHNASEWSENLCVHYLWLCLRRIMNCIREGHCSNYFIRECNLLYEKINDPEKDILNYELEQFTRREQFKDNVKSLPVLSGISTFSAFIPLVNEFLKNDCMIRFVCGFLSRLIEEMMGNIMFCFVSSAQSNDWSKSVIELITLLKMLKKKGLDIPSTESSLLDFLIRLLSCAQIRLINIAICRKKLSPTNIVSVVHKLQVDANLRAETLGVTEITQIAHVFFTNKLYENTLNMILPMLYAFENNPCIRVENIQSIFRLFSYFFVDMDNVSFTSTRRPVSNITFFGLEEAILTKDLRIEIASSNVEREQHLQLHFMHQLNVVLSPLVYAYYMKYKCIRNLRNLCNIDACRALRELEKQVESEKNHIYHSLNILGSSLYECGYIKDALKTFAKAYKQRNTRRSTLYHTAILLRKYFEDH